MKSDSLVFKKNILKNTFCVISGGRTGIGFEIVQVLLALGAKVVVLGRSNKALNTTFKKNKFLERALFLYECDIANLDVTKKVVGNIFKEFPGINLLINNASLNFEIPAEKMMPNMLELSIRSNLTSHFYLSILATRHMIKRKGIKKIINISAYSGGKAYPGLAHMHACKAGLDALTKTLAIEWARYKILVNAISPGPVLTKHFMHAHTRLARLQKMSSEKFFEEMKKRELPLTKFIDAEYIAFMVAYLASQSGDVITGQTFAVDGGAGISNSFFFQNFVKMTSRIK